MRELLAALKHSPDRTADIIQYINRALSSFDRDPPDTPYQRGYQAALSELWANIFDAFPPTERKDMP